jgi:arylsulfatase
LVKLDGRPVWAYKRTQQSKDGILLEGPEKPRPGEHAVKLDFTYVGKAGEHGKGGRFLLSVDGEPAGEKTIEAIVPLLFRVDETLDLGEDPATPILEDHAGSMPFKFTSKIAQVIIELK